MKRLGILAILVLVLFSSCFISNWESTRWEGDLSDMTEGLYNLTISQSGKNLVFTVQVNDEKLAELIADLDDDEEFTPPDEIFVWMNPTFVDGDNHIYNGMSNIMFPVGRKTVGADFYSDSTVEYDTDGVTRLDANTNTSVQIVVNYGLMVDG